MRLGKVTITTTSQATEDLSKVERALSLFLPPDISPTIRKYEGHHGNIIHLLSASLEKNRDIRAFLTLLREGMSRQMREVLCEQIPERMDADGVLHLRFDKQRAFLGEIMLTRGADSIVVSMKIPTYPKSRDEAIKRAREMLCG
ncbi:RNA-binding domain-containing protein [Methermicoccus shengliensis]|uniref:Exosome subunit n=1 Tax=Methermicoccus shengliensis TaxID=660064 RepID=A0A832RWT1_9EURY|nr:RNA-binding domain-containing protein [Methermicoccus shengliensis]KUK04342.1 MAG: Uncharacterized protein XD46_0926 [Euryarchaeota archaeon 55_53]KUK30157.1 MAG: Uncharacterized protein XD62_0758 [Methanosarcinales archeaon 56_1174]MDI3488329.1 RNA-binding protein [Methanosarcinales archaeon]MDN5294790.1 RNA-binding protein [Methanosarcinales archaeon]HIH69834.1 exosome subunit [Methermicoccus shengliensis]